MILTINAKEMFNRGNVLPHSVIQRYIATVIVLNMTFVR